MFNPEMNVVKFSVVDVITTSGVNANCPDETAAVPCSDDSWD